MATRISNHTRINNYLIKQINSKQPFYKPSYYLSLKKLKILKIYIETYLSNGFIKFSDFLTRLPKVFGAKINMKF